ncbi:UvrD-helicase domain-containing protein [Haliea sp. E1-2-M8]|uniref:UvrD-helicase domain-containing protein n=1 Tax=Haliea sp. E1-2-M8 TaxID=3064706 RepID=UPI00271FAE02|nr:UvrD-helicase domain-containing protein [Haliea sp. E1-2-M8]MDO8863332.1 UvrD-helicase domain-containing protein [Haliea sp. E1-2-M8]
MSARIHFISAGAGSGKTFRLTGELRDRLAAGQVQPAGVIATTFTRLAAGELQERVRRALIEAGEHGTALRMEQALIGTVNGVCGELLRRFAFEAGMPPEQQVIDEAQGNVLFYQAMEQALAGARPRLRKMNALSHRLQIVDQRSRQQLWRQEVKKIVDAARANNQSAADIRDLGSASAAALLAHFPTATARDLNAELLAAVNHALFELDTDHDRTQATADYLSRLQQAQAALIKRTLTWPEWIGLAKGKTGAKSRAIAEPVSAVAAQFEQHPQLQADLRDFCSEVFAIAAASLDTYQQLKNRKGLIDFVDQEQCLYQLLDHPEVAAVLREELQLLLVDEFQDTSPIQLALFLKLSTLADDVIWVGDIKQSIYGFRGADPALMDAVVARIGEQGSAPEVLPQSWRSTPALVAYSNALFAPAFADTLTAERVTLQPARPAAEVPPGPAVECWHLEGRNKPERAAALAAGVQALLASGRQVCDKDSRQLRAIRCRDIAILCRTHSNLAAIAAALATARLPLRYQRPGLLATPEGCLAMACLRRLIDPADTLASAEIISLTECSNPEHWLSERLAWLADPEAMPHRWREDGTTGPLSALAEARARVRFLTPVETLRLALDAGEVAQSVHRWGPTSQRSQHRLNNLAALLAHAEDYLEQCRAQREPATASGLVLWLQALADAEEDTQANGGDEDAIQLVTHHGAKGLEWPLVIAMDLASELKPRLWGLTVLPSVQPVSLDDPLAGRSLRYWPAFFGNNSTGIAVLDTIDASPEGQAALAREIQEAKRLLYVSLTRPRDALILTREGKSSGGPWMDTLGAEWMLPTCEELPLPDGPTIAARFLALAADNHLPLQSPYQPEWPDTPAPEPTLLPLRQSPSAFPPLADARIGEEITLGERLPLERNFDPATLGSALHAVIACRLLGHADSARILAEHGVEEIISSAAADQCSDRLLAAVAKRFQPTALYPEHPVRFINSDGQIVDGWIDLLLETPEGYIIIDHKASPRARGDWQEVALGYSGQLRAYAEGVTRASGRPVLATWIHFGVTGGLVEVCLP